MANNEKLQLALEKDLEIVKTSVDEVKKTADAALPSADLTQTKILELIDKLPVKNGGTGVTTLNNFFAYKGYLTTKDANDMWETGIYRVIGDNINIPGSAYGVLSVYYTEDYTVQIYTSVDKNMGQHISMRTGSRESKTWNPWHLFYTDKEVVPVSNGGTGKATVDEARENLNAQRRIPQYVSGEGADLDTGTFDFVLTTLTATKHKALQDLGFGSFAFVWQFFYQEANNERGRTQFAKSYLTNKIATRYYSNNTKSWSNWIEIITSENMLDKMYKFLGDMTTIELGANRTSSGVSFIDMHTNSNTDYDVRLYADANKKLSITATGGTAVSNVASGNGLVRNIQFSATDLIAGSSALSNGQIYLVYE